MLPATSIVGSSKREMHYARDGAGNVIREWNATWQRRSSYDAQQRVIRIWTDANPGPTQYEERFVYDAAGRVAQKATASGPGSKFSFWNMDYDAAGRVTRSWSDTDGDGQPESETRTSYDAAGRILAVHEDRDGNGAPDVSHGTDYNAAGQPTRRWRDVNGDGKPDNETRMTYDPGGHLVHQRTIERGTLHAELRWEYVEGKLTRWWSPLQPSVEGRITYDAAGNRAVEIDQNKAATHYEYDPATLAAVRRAAPAQCTAASTPYDHPEQTAMAVDPQRAHGGLAVNKAAPGPIVVPVPPAMPTLDADGFVSSAAKRGTGLQPPDTNAGARLASEYNAFVKALQEKTFADRGWAHVAIHAVPAGTKSRHLRGLRVAQGVRPCGEPTQYLVDRQGNVFVPNVGVSCTRQVVIKIHGAIAVSGCGREPPAVDLYAEVPSTARLQTAAPSIAITVPTCMVFQPDRGFEGPP